MEATSSLQGRWSVLWWLFEAQQTHLWSHFLHASNPPRWASVFHDIDMLTRYFSLLAVAWLRIKINDIFWRFRRQQCVKKEARWSEMPHFGAGGSILWHKICNQNFHPNLYNCVNMSSNEVCHGEEVQNTQRFFSSSISSYWASAAGRQDFHGAGLVPDVPHSFQQQEVTSQRNVFWGFHWSLSHLVKILAMSFWR